MMKGSDLGRGFSWNALQERGLDYQPERDRPALEAARVRASPGREVSTGAPEPVVPFIDLTKDAGREVIQPYLLDQANPVRQIENNVYLLQQTGGDIMDGVTALRDLVTKRNEVKQLSKALGFDSNERDAIERLQQAAGVEPTRDGDALERLSSMLGSERKDPADPAYALDKSLQPTPELTAMLEPVEEHAIEMTIDFTR
jgi:hypothetical protein